MSSTYAYTALSADYADLARPQQDGSVETPGPQTGSRDLKSRRWAKLYHALEVARGAYRRNVGLLLVVGSQMFFSLMNLAVKKLNSIDPPVSALELIVVRMGITYICSITYMLSTGVPDSFTGPKGVRLLLVFRGFSGFFGLFGIYFSLQYLSLSDATVLTFLSPLCTAAAGALFLSEKFTRREAFAGLLSLAGVILIARPPFIFGTATTEVSDVSLEEGAPDVSIGEAGPEQRLIAVGVALIGVLGATGAYISLRAIGKRAHPLHSLVSFSTQCVVVATIGMVVTKTPFIVPTQLDWLAMLIMIGIFGFVAQVLLTMGLARETAGRSSMAIYTQIVFATILERIFFHTVPALLSVFGTLVIISCALYVAVCASLAVIEVITEVLIQLTKDSSSGAGEDNKSTVRLRGGEEDSMECGLLRSDSEGSEHQKDLEHEHHGKEDIRDGLKANEDSPRGVDDL
ncbi:hypothetical protein P691DRAFT_683172 [Macrolepiota fuliginosa MF-IS2]|uniref:EamA domain-containing protein n=1 Tax=Macrolepiota fuliginosa MF-IS2 TaxID=1400762 RepID=A0A9P5X141_9AGAR|nr:hypothetical protein P691DRAFT_683172 [Macrolepiota fuliginosa MF-IS2]